MKYPEYKEVFLDLRKHTILQEEIFTKLESFICKIYGFEDSSSVNEVRKISFLSNYKKHKNQ